MPGLKDWFPVFKAGKQTDSKGREHFFTTEDLDKVVQNYQASNDNFQEAPIVLGHPKGTDPSFGWLEGFKREGEVLFAKCKDVVAEFEDMVASGLFPNRSISLNPDFTVNHLGFLGAVQPAIKGLGKIQFSQNEDSMTFEFMDSTTAWRINDIGDIFQRLRDFFIEKFDLETADKVLNQYTIDYLKQSKSDTPAESVSAFCKKIMEDINLSISKDKPAEFSKADFEAQQKENAQLKTEIDRLQAETRQKEFSSFCDDLVKDGKLLPAEKTETLDYMEIMHSTGEFEFSEGTDKSAVERFKTFLSKLPVRIEFSEIAKDGASANTEVTSSKAIAKKALEFQQSEAKEGRVIRIDEAVRHVSK